MREGRKLLKSSQEGGGNGGRIGLIAAFAKLSRVRGLAFKKPGEK